MDTKIITKDAKETKKLGFEFANKLKIGDVFLLYGELGSGKTTFAQGLAAGLGIKDRILSPTFVLQRSHSVSINDIKKLNHIDLYRIENPTEIASLGLSEVIEEENSVTLIEWADRLSNFNINQGYKIWFKHHTDNKREIRIEVING